MPLPKLTDKAHSSQPDLNTLKDDSDVQLEDLGIDTHSDKGIKSTRKAVKRKKPALDSDIVIDLYKEMRNMFNDLQKSQETKLDNLSKAMEAITIQNAKIINNHTEIEKILQQNMNAHNELLGKVSYLETECANAHIKINDLEDQVDGLLKYQLKKLVEIRNVPKQKDENIQNIVDTLLKTISVGTETNIIKHVYRAGKENAPIVMEVDEVKHKVAIIKAVKAYNVKNKTNRLNSSNLGIKVTPAVPVYISEKLTPKAKKLLVLSKTLVTDGIVKYCWTANGEVIVRQNDGLPAIRICKPSDVEKLKLSGPA